MTDKPRRRFDMLSARRLWVVDEEFTAYVMQRKEKYLMRLLAFQLEEDIELYGMSDFQTGDVGNYVVVDMGGRVCIWKKDEFEKVATRVEEK